MVKTVLSYNNTLRALTLLLLSVCALHGAWAEDKLTQDPLGTVVFHIPEGMVNGASAATNGSYSITPSKQSGVRSFVIPTNYTFFRNMDKDGYASTLQYWVEEKGDTTVHYVPGHSYTFASEGQVLTLVPVFKDNPASALNRTKVTIIRFDFTRKLHDYDDPSTNQRRKVCAPPVNIGSGDNQVVGTQTVVVLGVRNGGTENLLDIHGDGAVAEVEDVEGLSDRLAADQIDHQAGLAGGNTHVLSDGANLGGLSFNRLSCHLRLTPYLALWPRNVRVGANSPSL